jgi:hypothetical protein
MRVEDRVKAVIGVMFIAILLSCGVQMKDI